MNMKQGGPAAAETTARNAVCGSSRIFEWPNTNLTQPHGTRYASILIQSVPRLRAYEHELDMGRQDEWWTGDLEQRYGVQRG